MGLRQLKMALLVLDDSLLHFSLLKISFIYQNKTFIIWAMCFHVTIGLHLIETNSVKVKKRKAQTAVLPEF